MSLQPKEESFTAQSSGQGNILIFLIIDTAIEYILYVSAGFIVPVECSLSSSQGLKDSLRGLIFTVNLTRFGISWGNLFLEVSVSLFPEGKLSKKDPPYTHALESG